MPSTSLAPPNKRIAMRKWLVKRFTPVRIQAVQTSLFLEHRQKEKESVDSYAQTLRGLFHKAYPSAQRGSPEAESMSRAVLASQFTSGLRPELRAKVLGGGEESEYDCLSPSDIERFNWICWPRGWNVTVLIGIPTYLMSWLPINPAFKNRHKSPFFLLHGRDPRLPSVLDYDPPAHRRELPLDFDLASSLSQMWDLARSNVCEAQKAQKQAYNLKSRDVSFHEGDRVFVYMPKEKATKAYKFA